MCPTERQRIERVPGSRRVRLTPAPGTSAEPVAGDESADPGRAAASAASTGPNDERLRQDVPPHY